ncbi:MAG: hypothetical protein JWP37_365 [Mucilaginibacter sp.]|nr:hypothetical protein [Mucilaginibacter sp.]
METKERKSPITGNEGAEIKVHVAADWTKNHRHRHPGGIISQFFGVDILQRILQQPNCLGIRIYYANSKPLSGWQSFIMSIANFLIKVVADAEGEKHLILAGVTKEGMDQIPEHGSKDVAVAAAGEQTFHAMTAQVTSSTNILGEQSMPCPGGAGCPQNALTGA